MQRDFSALLAILLDAGMAEAEALILAASSTGNGILERRARLAVERIQNGERLAASVRAMDDTGELRWRLDNAGHAHGGFQQALAGWQETLSAQAFQHEQAAGQLLTTALVFVNGLVVALIAIGIVQALQLCIERASLW